MVYFSRQIPLTERINWLINLRWIAIAGVIIITLIANLVFKINLRIFPIQTISFLIIIYNFLFSCRLKQLKEYENNDYLYQLNVIAHGQIILDLLSLTALLHFSGGIENPFIFYFIFHMIIASILLSMKSAYLEATFAAGLFLSLVMLEYKNIIPHYCLIGFVPYTLHNNTMYIFGVFFVFVSTLYTAVYMTTSISKKLNIYEKELESANKLLEEKDRIKSEYVLRVTHDIKEHLSAIEGCIEPVTEKIAGSLNEQQLNLLNRAKFRTQKLNFFVQALLEVTRIKLAKKLEMEIFPFAQSVKSLADDINTRAKNKNITFSFYIDTSIDKFTGVKVYIEEAISNLLVNALKYTQDSGKINFEVRDKEKMITIDISDTGIGIPKDDMPFIFEEFYRAQNARQLERLGTGLGLSITKAIVQLHKGKISVESEEGKGTHFYLELPK